MALSYQAPAQRIGAVLALWRNVRVQRFAMQAAFAVLVIAIGYVLLDNLSSSLGETDLELFPFVEFTGGFPFVDISQDFLKQRAGFGIKETSFGFDYTANDSYRQAYTAGLLNTVWVAVIGIFLATIVGVVAGVARLSRNWLVSRMAMVYVETFRNVPLLVQLIFWYTAVVLKAPKFADSIDVFGVAFVSNRAIALPWADPKAGFGLWLLVLLLGLGVAAAVRVVRTRREDRTGRPSHPWWWAFGVLALIAIVAFFATGAPLDFDRPVMGEVAFSGGAQISPEFTALLIGLVLYTGTFIAEIVRGSILAIPKGQTEAAAAVGLNTFQRLRFVILPQAMRILLPPLTNQYLNLTKNSSLAVAVAFPDLFQVSRVSINQTGQAVPIIALVMVTYLAMSLIISLIMNTLNSRLKWGTR
jgi:general L-amino acid transport system permease protein